MAVGERSYDLWWDNKLIRKTVSYFLNAARTATSSMVTDTVSAYCRYSSPGRGVYNEAAQRWEMVSVANAEERKQGNNYYKCDNYPGYAGPSALPPTRRRRAINSGVEEELLLELVDTNSTSLDVSVSAGLVADVFQAMSFNLERKSPFTSRAMASGSGSFLDPSAWLYLCDASEDDVDASANTYSCGTDPSGDDVDDDGGWGDSPSPSPTATSSALASTTSSAPATTTTKPACNFWQALFMFVSGGLLRIIILCATLTRFYT